MININPYLYEINGYGQGHWSDDEDNNTLIFNDPYPDFADTPNTTDTNDSLFNEQLTNNEEHTLDDTIFSYISTYHTNNDSLYDEYRNIICLISNIVDIQESFPNVKTIYELIMNDYDNEFIPNEEQALYKYANHLASILISINQ